MNITNEEIIIALYKNGFIKVDVTIPDKKETINVVETVKPLNQVNEKANCNSTKLGGLFYPRISAITINTLLLKMGFIVIVANTRGRGWKQNHYGMTELSKLYGIDRYHSRSIRWKKSVIYQIEEYIKNNQDIVKILNVHKCRVIEEPKQYLTAVK